MSGIRFSGNTASQAPPAALASGFTVTSSLGAVNREVAGFGVPKADTGVSWYSKPAEGSPFGTGREVRLEPGTDVLSSALASAVPGDQFILAEGHYRESKIITLSVPVTVRAGSGTTPVLSFERPHLFVLTGNGGLDLEGLRSTGVSAPDGSGNSFISTSAVEGSGNHLLRLTDMQFEDFDVNRGFSVVSAAKGSFFDEITVSDSSFADISGIVFKLDQETDDYGIYNAEYLTLKDSRFENIGGSIASVYRGGRDESTFGPHVDVTGSTFTNIGRNAAPLMRLHGIQRGRFTGNTIKDAAPIDVTFTTGLPIFAMTDNRVDGAVQDVFANIKDLRNRK
jgi:poly(beta-D-mannuronate) lyase